MLKGLEPAINEARLEFAQKTLKDAGCADGTQTLDRRASASIPIVGRRKGT